MIKYISKFIMDILPSVAATIIGAYVVNHYIAPKPGANAPVAAAVSTVEPKKTDAMGAKSDVAKSDVKDSKKPPDVASAPESGTGKKSTPDKPLIEKAATEKAATEKAATEKVPEKASVVEKAVEKPEDNPTEPGSLPSEPRRRQPAPREKMIAKTAPVAAPVAVPAQTPPAQTPAVAAATVTPPVEASPTQEERRDANDMARAAIERLRKSGEASRAPEAAPRVADSPRVVSVPPVPPLPPAIMVTTPNGEAFNPSSTAPLTSPVARADDPRRPTPPADIPGASLPLDLHAEATASTREQRTTVADDFLPAAKSVFHAVLPQ